MEKDITPLSPQRLTTIISLGVFAALIAVGSYISIPLPFSPVPVSLQTLFVLLSGLFLGPVKGTLAVVLYLVLGSAGLPVFAGGTSGIARILGPTGGYLVGFIPGAFLAGFFYRLSSMGSCASETRETVPRLRIVVSAGVAALLGTMGIYLLGVSWLKIQNQLTWNLALTYGLVPFLVGDGVKILVAAALAPLGVSLFQHEN